MDRDRIERRDFSAARRGYDTDEVDQHLRRVADEVERIERERRSSEGLAGVAAEQIRGIVGAAERSAAEIRQRAEDEARSSSEETEAYAHDVRTRADADAAEHVERVQQATDRLLEQTSAAESELERLLDALRAKGGSLVEDLRSGAESVQGELRQIRDGLPALNERPGNAESVSASAALAAGGGATPATPEPEVDVAGEEDEELPAEETADEFAVDEGEPAAEREGAAAEAPAADEGAAAEPAEGTEPTQVEAPDPSAAEEPSEAAEEPRRAIAGSEGARLIALNMALNGTPREETASYLSENFNIEDQDAVLDEVYSRVSA